MNQSTDTMPKGEPAPPFPVAVSHLARPRGRSRAPAFFLRLYPHSGTWKQALTVRQGYDFNYHLSAVQVTPHSGKLPGSFSFLKAEPENVVVTAMKKTETAMACALTNGAARKGPSP